MARYFYGIWLANEWSGWSGTCDDQSWMPNLWCHASKYGRANRECFSAHDHRCDIVIYWQNIATSKIDAVTDVILSKDLTPWGAYSRAGYTGQPGSPLTHGWAEVIKAKRLTQSHADSGTWTRDLYTASQWQKPEPLTTATPIILINHLACFSP
jgi:hypothetical protein